MVKQRMRKQLHYRRVRKAKQAKMLSLLKKIAAVMPAPPIEYDEYHKIASKLPSEWTIGHARSINC